MADRRLVALFPRAAVPDKAFLDKFLRFSKEANGEIDTMFDMDIYNNPIGIEIETENFTHMPKKSLYMWTTEIDGSLRNRGIEFISRPLVRTAIDYALHEFNLVQQHNKLAFGHRTSVHVHVNVSHYTKNQLTTLVALFALLEECFYSIVNQDRSGSPFCYRIVGTDPVIKFINGDQITTKYCALNIAPVMTQMTVEFRHLEGTGDPVRLRRWIQICTKLVNYVGTQNPKTCKQDLMEAIEKGEVQSKLVPAVWGATAEIFNPSLVSYSIRNGELWAMTLLTGE